MKFSRVALAASLVGAFLVSAPAMAAETVVGSSDGAGCYPFVCNDGAAAFDFYQIYSADAFNGAITFDAFRFFAYGVDELGFAEPQILAGDYDISFGLTSDPVGSFAPLNLENEASFFSGHFAGGGLSFTGDSAYAYDPAGGKNLVMHVLVSGQADTPINFETLGVLAADYTTGSLSQTGRVTYADASLSYDLAFADGALVTAFSPTAAPEPAAWALMIAGFGLTGTVLRKRRRQVISATT